VLGDLAHEAAVEPLRALKIDLAGELFALLREHGLMRTDLDIDTQRYVLSAVQTGFYLSEPVTAVTAPPEFAAAALSHTSCQAVQTPGSPDPDALAALVPKVIAMYEPFLTSKLVRTPFPRLARFTTVYTQVGGVVTLRLLLGRYRGIEVALDEPVAHRDPWTMVAITRLPLGQRQALWRGQR
jgi:hypothetical protein